jgi:hypothetical protein
MEEDVDTFADAVIDVDDDIPFVRLAIAVSELDCVAAGAVVGAGAETGAGAKVDAGNPKR